MDKLLYFPYMSIPNSKWMLQNLLYWDEVASIIPYEFKVKPERLEKHTQLLLQEGLLTTIHPEDYIFSIDRFSENFINYVDIRMKDNPHLTSNNFLSSASQLEKVHMGKLSDVGYQLVERGLAIRQGHWFLIESHTAKSFMTYLAIILGNKIDFTPVTDRYNGFEAITSKPVSSRLTTTDFIVTNNKYQKDYKH